MPPNWPLVVQTGIRAGGCGLFYGLLAFHLTRVDPNDTHLQAGLVGAVCGIHSLGLPLGLPATTGLNELLATGLPHLAVALLRAWLPVAASALLLVLLPRRWPGLQP
jgi:H+/Cl- antiporter ClcA